MARASDPRLVDLTKKRPSSAPKPGELSDIPKIILSDRKEASSIPSSLSSSVHVETFSTTEVDRILRDGTQKEAKSSGHSDHVIGSMSGRSSSDIGLPAASMPNLLVSLGPGGEMSSSDNYLEVFCSPRTFRRSVDLDSNAKEQGRGHFEWAETMDSSNCLKVLTSSSRVGSAVSLNSECTARSIGLLSNDSDSENDLSLTESEKLAAKPAQLRRFMSYPEDSTSRDQCARGSQSMSDLKTMDKTEVVKEQTIGGTPETEESVFQETGSPREKDTPEVASSRTALVDNQPILPVEPRLPEKIRAHRNDKSRDRNKTGGPRSPHMLSYKCDTHDAARDCRIRQWLQDMD